MVITRAVFSGNSLINSETLGAVSSVGTLISDGVGSVEGAAGSSVGGRLVSSFNGGGVESSAITVAVNTNDKTNARLVATENNLNNFCLFMKILDKTMIMKTINIKV